jgi:predicted secreted Zn-dependent protease
MLCAASAESSVAEIQANTFYKYYEVTGNSVRSLHKSMLRRGPNDVNGANAYGLTLMARSWEGQFVQNNECQIVDFKIKASFVIHLPKAKNEKALSSETMTHWRRFASFVRKHEEKHRSIYMSCAGELEKLILAMRERDCETLNQKSIALWENVWRQCDSKNDVFDNEEQARLVRNPFIKIALRGAPQPVQTEGSASKRKRALRQP